MKITVLITREVDWDGMTRQKILEQDMPYDLEYFCTVIDKWNELFNVSYFGFRKRLASIARRNWEKFADHITSQWTNLPSGYYLICDEDDWFNPQIKDMLRGSLVYWKPTFFKTCEWEKKEFISPYFDGCHKRKLYSFNWAIRSDFYNVVGNKELLKLSITANKLIDNNTVFLERRLNMANKTMASMTCMLSMKDDLRELMQKNLVDVSIPERFMWAKDEVEATMDLYKETFK